MSTATRGSLIHPTAIIHPDVELGEGSYVGPLCVIGDDTGHLKIGAGAHIRSHTVLYGGSEYGPNLETGHYTLLRSGNSVGENLRIGSYSSLEGGAEIGDFVRIHGRCEMTGAIMRDFSRIYGGTYITDNKRPPSYVNELCVLDEGSVVTMGCILVAGIRLGIGSYVAAGMVVAEDVPDGYLLKRNGTMSRIRKANIWPPRYRADYPAHAQSRLDDLERELLELAL